MNGPGTPSPRGRGARLNPPNRFETTHHELELEQVEEDEEYPRYAETTSDGTSCPTNHAASSPGTTAPDVGFRSELADPYRGCEHGCIYCYARPTHEYLGFSAGLDFETKILIKHGAPELLRKALSAPGWKPQVLGMSGVTDAYQPKERQLGLTRRCLAVLAEYRQAVTIITKNRLVTRDIDLLAELAQHNAAGVFVSITSLDDELIGRLEPRTTRPRGRLSAIAALAAAGIPTGVMVAPVIPGLTEHEIPSILKAAAEAGARSAGYTLVRLPLGVAGLFDDWLGQHFPDRKDKVLERIRAVHGGRLNDSRFGVRMSGEGNAAEMISQIFRGACRRAGLNLNPWPVSATAFRRPARKDGQLTLFE